MTRGARRAASLWAAAMSIAVLVTACASTGQYDTGTSSRSEGPKQTSPPPPECAPGTRDLGHHDGYADGRRHRILLCAVDGLPSDSPESTPGTRHYLKGANGDAVVHAQISRGTTRLRRLAERQGVELGVTSSFRTHEHQRELCDEDPGCAGGDHRLVSPAGHSSHQMGLALDFRGTGATGTRSCAKARATDPESRVWRFLNQHADRHGLRQYAAESWHWESAHLPTACRPAPTASADQPDRSP